MSQDLAVYGAVLLLSGATLWAFSSSLVQLQRNYARNVAQLEAELELMRQRHAQEDAALRQHTEHLREILRHCTCASATSHAESRQQKC